VCEDTLPVDEDVLELDELVAEDAVDPVVADDVVDPPSSEPEVRVDADTVVTLAAVCGVVGASRIAIAPPSEANAATLSAAAARRALRALGLRRGGRARGGRAGPAAVSDGPVPGAAGGPLGAPAACPDAEVGEGGSTLRGSSMTGTVRRVPRNLARAR
jgi:hypothetical protein